MGAFFSELILVTDLNLWRYQQNMFANAAQKQQADAAFTITFTLHLV